MKVLIAGAGIGGLAAALALSRIGAAVVVAERAPALTSVGAGLQLSPNASRVLRRLGVLDAVAARATRPGGIRVRSARSGRTLCFMPLGDAERRWGAPYLVIRRADLQDVLAQAVAADGAVALRLGTSLAGFGTTAAGVVQATLKHGLVARTLDADALIGADGVRSTVRARLAAGTNDAPRETGRTAWRALVDAAAVEAAPEETGLWLGGDAHLVHYPIDGGRLVNVVAVTREPASAATAEAAWAEPGAAATIGARFAGWHPAARALIAAAPTWTTWPLFDRAPLAAWNAGPVALLGDAAHPILPFLAQGAAQAIEDAGALADALASSDIAIGDALDGYSRARLGRVTRVQDTSRRLGQIYHLRGPAAVARDAALRALGGTRLLARQDWLYRA